ncbi:MAG: peptidase S53, partial [Euryarchaeota archaeon]|nr:peptidase S53 [Euryarchaeota archaeon]
GSTLTYKDTSVTNGVTYYYYVTAVNSVGESPKSNEVSATPKSSSNLLSNKILFVDDDGGSAYSDYIKQALIDSGITQEYQVYVWDVYSIGYSPGYNELMKYGIVIWSTGYTYVNTVTPTDQQNLIKYLNSGGRLYLSSQDFLWEVSGGFDGAIDNAFVNDYLGVSGVINDVGYTYIYGVSGNPITGNFGTVYLKYPYGNYDDEIGLESGAQAIFVDDYGYAAGDMYQHGNYKVVFTAFSFEAVEYGNAQTGAQLMYDIVSWLAS